MHEKTHANNFEYALDIEHHSKYEGEIFEHNISKAFVLPVRIVVDCHAHGVAEDHEDDEVIKPFVLD